LFIGPKARECKLAHVIESVAQLAPSDPTTAAVERAFSRHVAERLNGRMLRYSQRLEFLKAAQRLRINRFRANLIIAMVQHQSPPTAQIKPEERTSSRLGPIIAGVLLAELATVAGVWWMLHG
jgi:hypothetical protein